MAEPLDAIMAIHNAFRHDMSIVDTAALQTARGEPGLAPTLERYRFLNEVLVWHAHGEEIAIFPALEAVAPLVAEAYLMDHHGLDAAFDALDKAYNAGDVLETARAASAFKFHLDMHLKKEDAHLYRLVKERVPSEELAKAAGVMSGAVPQDRFPDVIAWEFPLIGIGDRENMTRILQMVLPPPVFANVKLVIQKAIGDDWAELTQRIPNLA